MAMKHCSKCFEVLPENDMHFVKDSRNKSGISSKCKGCNVDRTKKYTNIHFEKRRKYWSDYYRLNKRRIREYNSSYYKNEKEVIKNSNKNYYWKNRVTILNKKRRYYQLNKDKLYKSKLRWNNKNKEHYKVLNAKHAHIRRQNKKRGVIDFTSTDWQQCLTYFNHQCAYCGSTESLEQEHVIPVSRGGHYTPDNIIPACRSCNASKNNKIMQDWFTQQEIYSVERMANILKYVQKNKTEVNI